MKRKVLSTILAASMLATLVVGCGGGGDTQTNAPAEDAGTEAPAEGGESAAADAPSGVAADKEGGKVGVAMPTQSSTQVSQIENMIAADADCLGIAAVDSGALTTVEAQAKEKGIPIIAYDRLLMDTDAVSYYASFDNEGVGTAIGEYIKTAKDLDDAKAAGESYTI